MITIEIIDGDKPELTQALICLDKEGLAFLKTELDRLHHDFDHLHFMTPSWAGNELSENIPPGGGYLCNHLKILYIESGGE